jgi:hypothetical protein
VDDDADLAERLGVGVPTLHRLLGRGWQRRADVLDRRPARQWFGTGEPVQVLLAADDGALVLALPRGLVNGVPSLRYEAVDLRSFARADLLARPAALMAAARDITTRRRQGFRWCPTCRQVHPPEDFARSAVRCTTCQELVDGPTS